MSLPEIIVTILFLTGFTYIIYIIVKDPKGMLDGMWKKTWSTFGGLAAIVLFPVLMLVKTLERLNKIGKNKQH